MAEQTAESIAQRAFDLNLLSDRQLQEIWGEFGRRNVTVDEFVQLLLRRELMTNFQLERLLRGEKGGYFYGDYKVLYIVAGGSFARVYRAVHKDSGKVVALKVLRRRYSEDTAQTEQFYREGLMGVSLRHPNIVPIYEAISKGNQHYLVMEFVEGGNLRDFMKVRKKFSPIEATKVAVDIAAGLDYAFQRGISHRDLKLTNVLLSSRGQAKLVDFGLAGADEKIADESIAGEGMNTRTIDYAGLERRYRGAQGRCPQRHLFHRLYLLPHAVRAAGLAGDARPHSAAFQVAIHRRGADSPGLPRHPARGSGGGQ